MNTITHTQRYLLHEISTKYHAVKLYRSWMGVAFVTTRYHISKASLMRWNKFFDGTKKSLIPKSHRPHTPHPNAHTVVIRTSPFANCMENCVHKKVIPDTLVPFIVSIDAWVTPLQLLLLKNVKNLCHTTLHSL